MKKILLIKASTDEYDIRNYRRELRPSEIVEFVVHSEKTNMNEINVDYFDGIVISGSSYSVTDTPDWASDLDTFISWIIQERDIPILGVCWGCQFLAYVLGGTVRKGESRELGFRNISTDSDSDYSTIDHSIFDGISSDFTAFESHEDYIIDLPKKCSVLAHNNLGIQSFTYNNKVVGTQFHPEVDYSTAEILCKKYQSQNTTPEIPDCSLESYVRAEESRDVLRNFVSMLD